MSSHQLKIPLKYGYVEKSGTNFLILPRSSWSDSFDRAHIILIWISCRKDYMEGFSIGMHHLGLREKKGNINEYFP